MQMNVRAVMLVSIFAITACSPKETPNTADSSAVSAAEPAGQAPNVVNITASEYKFDAPDQIPAGVTKFILTDAGKELHHASLIKLDSGKTMADLMNGLKNMKPGTQPPGWMIPAGGPNTPVPGGTSNLTMVLEPGNYAIVCFIPDAKGVPHAMHGMSKALTVTPATNANMTEPASDITLSLKDYSFDFSTPLTAGKHTIKIVTAQGQPHEAVLFQLSPGKTAADITKYVEGGMQGPPPAAPLGGIAGMAAGMNAFYEVDLQPGEYALVCFLEDAKDGKPHFVHGMIQQFKVS